MTRYDDIPLYGQTRAPRGGLKYDSRARDPYAGFRTKPIERRQPPEFSQGPSVVSINVEQLSPIWGDEVRMMVEIELRSQHRPDHTHDKRWILSEIRTLLRDRFSQQVTEREIERNLNWHRSFTENYWNVEFQYVYLPDFSRRRPPISPPPLYSERFNVNYVLHSVYGPDSEGEQEWAANRIQRLLENDHHLDMDFEWIKSKLKWTRAKYEREWTIKFEYIFAKSNGTWYPFESENDMNRAGLKTVKIDGEPVGWARVENGHARVPSKVSELIIHNSHVDARTGITFNTTSEDMSLPSEPSIAGWYKFEDGTEGLRVMRDHRGRWSYQDLNGNSAKVSWSWVVENMEHAGKLVRA
jgi:hypothetical protein